MSWNPFQLAGPPFLAFYIALLAVTVWLLRRTMRTSETAGTTPPPKFDDPYLIACLRGGDDEAIRVATVALVDRGLLVADGDRVSRRDARAVELVRRDIERALLRAYASPGDTDRAKRDPAVRSALAAYRRTLEEHGLAAGAAVRTRRLPQIVLAAGVLLGVSLVRTVQALSHGRHNLDFLAALTLIAAVTLFVHWRRRRTFAGDAALADLKALFKRLKDRASTLKAGGAGNEAALLAAVFGLAALPASAFPFVEKLYPKASGDSSGGSDGSSCGSSCGGGCGGGGCGGD